MADWDLKLTSKRAKVLPSVRTTNVPFARGAMAARQVLTLKIEVRVLAGEPSFSPYCIAFRMKPSVAKES